MKAALRKKLTDSPKASRTGRRVSDGTLHPMRHEGLDVGVLSRCDTVDLADVPGSRKSRSRSPSPNIQTIPEDGEMPPKRVPRFKKGANFDIPRSRSPSPVPPEYAEQAALLNAQWKESNNPLKPSPVNIRKLTPSVSVTSPDGGTSDKENGFGEKEEKKEGDEDEKRIEKTKKSAEKLRYIIDELIETEIGYGNDLSILMSTYLKPLKVAGAFPDEDIEALINNVKEIIEFQEVFQKSVVEAKQLVSEYQTLEDPNEFRRIVFSIGSAFLFHLDTFNLYSTFCAVHSKAQKLLKDSGKEGKQLVEFLQTRTLPDGSSASLGFSSYLIKPMQRILKYPLLIREMQGRFDPESETFYHLGESLKEMQRVANHINDMMKVHEQYGNIFESLLATTQPDDKKNKIASKELNMDDLVKYDTVFWSNSAHVLGKAKNRNAEPEMTVLVFKTAVVLISREARRGRRRSLVDYVSGSNAADDVNGTCFKKLIPIKNVQVKTSDDEDCEDFFPWELVQKDSSDLQDLKTVFRFYSSTVDLRNEFMKTIKQTINDYNRKRILQSAGKAAHVVRKISEYKYGGKRLEDLKSSKPMGARTLRRFASSAEESTRKLKNNPPSGKNPPPKRTETV